MTTPPKKKFGKPHPLSAEEKTHILRLNATGLSIHAIRRELRALGFRRGYDSVHTFLKTCDTLCSTTRTSDSPPPDHHVCHFCAWTGPSSDYYGHWRTQHRRRAGYTPSEITRHV